jgi:hypothetical protein
VRRARAAARRRAAQRRRNSADLAPDTLTLPRGGWPPARRHGNGVFTHYFVEGLRGPANAGKRTISTQQAFEYAATRTSAFGSGQSPQLLDNRGKEFRLATF